MAGRRRGREKVVGGGPDARAGEPGRRDEKGQVSRVFIRMAGLAGVVLTPSSRQGASLLRQGASLPRHGGEKPCFTRALPQDVV